MVKNFFCGLGLLRNTKTDVYSSTFAFVQSLMKKESRNELRNKKASSVNWSVEQRFQCWDSERLTPSACHRTIVSPRFWGLNPAPLCCSVCLHSHQLAVRQCAHRQRWAQGRVHQKCACCITEAVPSWAVTHARSHHQRVISFVVHVWRVPAFYWYS